MQNQMTLAEVRKYGETMLLNLILQSMSSNINSHPLIDQGLYHVGASLDRYENNLIRLKWKD